MSCPSKIGRIFGASYVFAGAFLIWKGKEHDNGQNENDREGRVRPHPRVGAPEGFVPPFPERIEDLPHKPIDDPKQIPQAQQRDETDCQERRDAN